MPSAESHLLQPGNQKAAVDPHAITNTVVNNTIAFFSTLVLPRGSVEAGSTSQRRTLFNALMNQILTGVMFAKVVLTVDTTFTDIHLSIYGQSNIPEVFMAIIIIFLGLGFIPLLTSLLLQESYLEYAEPVALISAICVLANLSIFFAVLFPTKVDPVVRISATLFIAFLCIPSYAICKMRKQ
ncbi:hypothetical protein Nepgr_017090 [Nepenthes gracilis]|uniref:Uncharacterized protein n=1 Tax=Nepenthes gracilis TaxID=150966 RepID=A0AAD3SQW8_NEPGR|nr:hypothetical protein Nepgr_017090 [Nepenthes gracilis]